MEDIHKELCACLAKDIYKKPCKHDCEGFLLLTDDIVHVIMHTEVRNNSGKLCNQFINHFCRHNLRQTKNL